MPPTAGEHPSSNPSTRRRIAASILAVLALAHLHLVLTVILGMGSEPAALFAGHLFALPVAASAAAAIWSGLRWDWLAVVLYGVVGSLLILGVGPALHLPRENRPMLWVGAALVLLCAMLCARWLRRQRHA